MQLRSGRRLNPPPHGSGQAATNQLSLSHAMQLRSGRRLLDPPPHEAQRRRRRRRLAPRGPEAADVDGVTEEDRISSLPEDLLLNVLARLGCARKAARTSVVARRWRGLWTRLPELRFLNVNSSSFHLLEGLLAQVTRPTLNLLHVEVRSFGSGWVMAGDVSSLLHAAARLAPKNLTINLYTLVANNAKVGEHNLITFWPPPLELPCCDRTTSLTLDMTRVDLAPPSTGKFTALERLVLSSSNIELGSLLPMCPSLRYLSFDAHSDLDMVTVHSTSLEELDLYTLHYEGGYEISISCIDIMAPLLKKARLGFASAEDFNLSFSAPMVEDFYWECLYEHAEVGLEHARPSKLIYNWSHDVHQKLELEIEWEIFLSSTM